MKKNEPKRDRNQEQVAEAKSPLEEIIREGARKLLQSAIEREIADYMSRTRLIPHHRGQVNSPLLPDE